MGYRDDDACLAKVGPDEPIFVLRAQDELAPYALRHWIQSAKGRGVTLNKRLEVARELSRMLAWQKDHPDQVKLPD